ncbi:MAG: integrase [Firmicutes bacterium]|nr:integrase [Bacillota bacterium]
MASLINKMKINLQLRGYSLKTQEAYIRYIKQFYDYYNKPFEQIGTKEIRKYLYYLQIIKKYSDSYVNQNYSALRFLYKIVLNQEWSVKKYPRLKRNKKLPVVLSRDEISNIFSAITNFKHKAILTTIYSAGLRISEAANLIIEDIDSKNMQIRVKQGKGKKDRYTILSKSNLQILRDYWKIYKPSYYLFPGRTYNKPISTRSIQVYFKKTLKKAGITKHATVHTLRHCFATHLLEAGIDIYHIQNLMGHTSPKTTNIYIHLTRKDILSVTSPLDILMGDSDD